MRSFFSGFEKRAAEEAESPAPEWVTRYLAPAAAVGGAAAVGTYALSRMGGKKLLAPVMYATKDRPKSFIGKAIDRLRHGADEIVDMGTLGAPSSTRVKVLKPGEVALLRDIGAISRIKGKKSQLFGTTQDVVDKFQNNKAIESTFISKVAPKLHPKTEELILPGFTPVEKLTHLKGMHEKWKGKGGYFIKDVESFQSGPGGEKFLSESDLDKFFMGKLKGHKEKALRDVLEKPMGNFIIQRKLDIVKDPVSGKGVEFRVHSVGDKVIDTTLRTGQIPNPLEARRAEGVMKEFVSRMPDEMKKNKTMFAADVIKTKDGYKIVELNPGAASGYLDPNFMKEKGLLGHLHSIILSNKIYSEIAGRASVLNATGRGIAAGAAAGGLTAGGMYAYDKKDEIAQRFNPQA